MNLQYKTVLLTGACGGIGQQLARQLAERGATLVLVGRKRQRLEALAETLPGTGHRWLAVDLMAPDATAEIYRLGTEFAAAEQPIDILLNAAGANQLSLLSERGAESVERELRLNLLVPMLLAQAAVDYLARPGLIVNVGSVLGAIGYPGYSVYGAAKGGLHRFSEALYRELGDQGIKVLYVAPRATNTALNDERATLMNKALGNHTDTPQWVAAQIVSAIEQEKSVRWLGWPERLLVRINQLLPSLVSHFVGKQLPLIRQFLVPQERKL